MYKKFGLILAALIAVTVLPNEAYSFQNPLKTYDLYADTHRPTNQPAEPSERETVMGEYYSNSLRPPGHGAQYAAESAAAANTGDTSEFNANGVKRRREFVLLSLNASDNGIIYLCLCLTSISNSRWTQTSIGSSFVKDGFDIFRLS